MPALQIKDCPKDVYERLRACAKAENRSIAQQALTIVEDYLDARDRGFVAFETVKPAAERRHPSYAEVDDGVDYLAKHMRALERISKLPSIPITETAPRADIILAQIREEEAR